MRLINKGQKFGAKVAVSMTPFLDFTLSTKILTFLYIFPKGYKKQFHIILIAYKINEISFLALK